MASEQSGEWKVRLDSSLSIKGDSWLFSTDAKRLSMEGSLANPQSDALDSGTFKHSRATKRSRPCSMNTSERA